MNAYCQEVKNIADQLANDALVLQLITVLSELFDGIATILQQTTPLPDFYTTHSNLCMEESRKASQSPHAALHTVANHNPYPTAIPPATSTDPAGTMQPFRPTGRGQPDYPTRGRGRGGHCCGVVVAADVPPTYPTCMAVTPTIIPTLGLHHRGQLLLPHTLRSPTPTPRRHHIVHSLAQHPTPVYLDPVLIMPTPRRNTPILRPTLNKPCTR